MEEILNGTVCQICGCWLEDFEDFGSYPRSCEDCEFKLEEE